MGRLLTVGHGTLDKTALSTLLSGARDRALVVGRPVPGSRHIPYDS